MRFVLRCLRRYRQFDLADMKLLSRCESLRLVSFRKNFVWKSRTARQTFKRQCAAATSARNGGAPSLRFH